VEGAENFFRYRVQTELGVHKISYSMGTGSSLLGSEADHSPPSRAKVKNVWSYTSTPPICLRGVVLS
jgi:hypothetical protein